MRKYRVCADCHYQLVPTRWPKSVSGHSLRGYAPNGQVVRLGASRANGSRSNLALGWR